jgi:hypothetical protein
MRRFSKGPFDTVLRIDYLTCMWRTEVGGGEVAVDTGTGSSMSRQFIARVRA